MQIDYEDFNGAKVAFGQKFHSEWQEIEVSLGQLAPHLKASDQAGKQGDLIFDPVGTNEAIKSLLTEKSWQSNIRMPEKYSFLGTDVDFVKPGVLVEVQFSNYPFLLNNVVRSELLRKAKVVMGGGKPEALVIVTKAHMFPASNSTLYYEQGVNQLRELSSAEVFGIPIRLVGLKMPLGVGEIQFTEYHSSRYSRTVVSRGSRQVDVSKGRSARSRSKISFR